MHTSTFFFFSLLSFFADCCAGNIGNPQQLGQQPITYFRQVLALVEYDKLLEGAAKSAFPADAVARAQAYLKEVKSVGAYSHSQGVELVRREVADFIGKRDGFLADPELVFLTDGASPGVQAWIRALIRNESDGLMIPIPQYPLYSACIPLYGGSAIEYFLDEKGGWSLSVEALQKSFDSAKGKKINPRALVVINPGNPTGQCLNVQNIRDIIGFCADRKIVIMADEVYQENVYVASKPFVSFRKVLKQLQQENATRFGAVQLVSFHSTSKGMIGECGKRGGYFEAIGIPPDVRAEFYKLASISLCPNVIGQLTVGLMVNPPRQGDPSYALYKQEVSGIYDSLKRRAEKVTGALRALEGVTCNPSEGAMYCFPQIRLPHSAIAAAKQAGVAPDLFYCLALLENTGICVVPGSGFGQEDGTFHFRTTFLPLENQLDPVLEKMAVFHKQFMAKYKQ